MPKRKGYKVRPEQETHSVPLSTGLIDKRIKRTVQKIELEKIKKEAKTEAIEKNVSELPRKEKISLFVDAIYRSHIDPKKIFGEDVSFCYGKYSNNPQHYKLVPFSQFDRGSVMFELTFLDDCDDVLDYTVSVAHHPGVGRGRLPEDGLNISRIFLDPKDFSKDDPLWKYINELNHAQMSRYGDDHSIVIEYINRKKIVNNMHSNIRLHMQHPLHKITDEKSELKTVPGNENKTEIKDTSKIRP